jgi:hypothetical protein
VKQKLRADSIAASVFQPDAVTHNMLSNQPAPPVYLAASKIDPRLVKNALNEADYSSKVAQYHGILNRAGIEDGRCHGRFQDRFTNEQERIIRVVGGSRIHLVTTRTRDWCCVPAEAKRGLRQAKQAAAPPAINVSE